MTPANSFQSNVSGKELLRRPEQFREAFVLSVRESIVVPQASSHAPLSSSHALLTLFLLPKGSLSTFE
ncbi:hypothetical protein RE6C_00469 [Rhodopirellula europaea 6C]|uniref:Uncharacterized protein n=1 Tax=Rhodopirellula europaea 6C TaxID=1263867 RepID=M2A9H6_9BACT|nr:hypothetical protein RE6C_00469 [Rhodopirellula europaea 6C]